MKRLLPLIFLLSFSAKAWPQSDASSPPEWVTKANVSLPPVSKAVVGEMRRLWPVVRDTGSDMVHAPRPGEYDGDKRVAELGSQAGLAMIWIYALSEPVFYILPTDDAKTVATKKYQAVQSASRNRQNILDELGDDKALVPWLLPLLRARRAAFFEAIKSHRVEEVFDIPEIDLLNHYLDTYGTDEDVAQGDKLAQSLETYYGEAPSPEPFSRPPLSERKEELAYNRHHAQGFRTSFADQYKARVEGFDRRDKGSTTTSVQTSSNPEVMLETTGRSRPVESSHQGSASVAETLNSQELPSRAWIAWLAVSVIVAIGAVRLFLHKSKP